MLLLIQKRTEKFVLKLTIEELISLVDLILWESELSWQDRGKGDETLDQASCSLIQSRLPLLHSCCHSDPQNVHTVCEYLLNCIKKWGNRYGVYIPFLRH